MRERRVLNKECSLGPLFDHTIDQSPSPSPRVSKPVYTILMGPCTGEALLGVEEFAGEVPRLVPVVVGDTEMDPVAFPEGAAAGAGAPSDS